jgi:DNA polymerase III alpha subunit
MEGGGHLVLLAESVDGYGSPFALDNSLRCASEDKRRPRCPLDLLLNHARGLICLSGAVPFGLIPSLVLSDRASEAREILGQLSEAFGQEGVFVELTDDLTAGAGQDSEDGPLCRENRAPVLATNEVAYLRRREHRLHDVSWPPPT